MKNFAVMETQSPNQWSKWTFSHPLIPKPVPGKLFLREPLGLDSMEVSLNELRPGAAVPFLHQHERHEELYIFLDGEGEFVVDGTHFPVAAGTVVRVDPAGKRSWRNVGSVPLHYLVIQAQKGSLSASGIQDGVPCAEPAPW